MMSFSHESTLKNWTRSAEYNRIRLKEIKSDRMLGQYSVRLEGSNKWIARESAPLDAAEWLFIDIEGTPIFHWSKERKSIMLIG